MFMHHNRKYLKHLNTFFFLEQNKNKVIWIFIFRSKAQCSCFSRVHGPLAARGLGRGLGRGRGAPAST